MGARGHPARVGQHEGARDRQHAPAARRGARELHGTRKPNGLTSSRASVRFYLIDDQRQTLVEDLGPGDLWLAPAGFPSCDSGT